MRIIFFFLIQSIHTPPPQLLFAENLKLVYLGPRHNIILRSLSDIMKTQYRLIYKVNIFPRCSQSRFSYCYARKLVQNINNNIHYSLLRAYCSNKVHVSILY